MSATKLVTVRDVAKDYSTRSGLSIYFDESVEIGIMEIVPRFPRPAGIYIHPDSLDVTLKEQTAQTVMFDPNKKAHG